MIIFPMKFKFNLKKTTLWNHLKFFGTCCFCYSLLLQCLSVFQPTFIISVFLERKKIIKILNLNNRFILLILFIVCSLGSVSKFTNDRRCFQNEISCMISSIQIPRALLQWPTVLMIYGCEIRSLQV